MATWQQLIREEIFWIILYAVGAVAAGSSFVYIVYKDLALAREAQKAGRRPDGKEHGWGHGQIGALVVCVLLWPFALIGLAVLLVYHFFTKSFTWEMCWKDIKRSGWRLWRWKLWPNIWNAAKALGRKLRLPPRPPGAR